MNLWRRGEKNGTPTWVLRWSARDPATGKQKPIYETFHGARRAAERRWMQREAELRGHGGHLAPSRQPLSAYLATWLESVAPDLGPATERHYRDICRLYIVPALGAVALTDLSPAMVQEWLSNLHGTRGRVGPRTVAAARGTLRLALENAVRLGLLVSNPVDRTRGPRHQRRQRARRVDAFSIAEAESLIALAYSRTRYGPLLEFLWLSALRPSEALGLRWDAVDWEKGTLHVTRTRVQVAGRMIDQERTKTAAGVRELALPKRAVEALRRQRAMHDADRANAGAAYEDHGYVFATATGGGLRLDNLDKAFRRLRAAAGVPDYTFYALRHTGASIQISAGVPIAVVSKRLGHANISITVDTYGHLMPEANRDAAQRVDDFLERSATNPLHSAPKNRKEQR